MRQDVEFSSEVTTCAGWLFPAAGNDAAGPAIVMAHGFGGVRGMDLPPFAEHFAENRRTRSMWSSDWISTWTTPDSVAASSVRTCLLYTSDAADE